jgi:hypothetical protein
MSVSEVLGEAFDLYRRFFWRFVATAAVVFVVLAPEPVAELPEA